MTVVIAQRRRPEPGDQAAIDEATLSAIGVGDNRLGDVPAPEVDVHQNDFRTLCKHAAKGRARLICGARNEEQSNTIVLHALLFDTPEAEC